MNVLLTAILLALIVILALIIVIARKIRDVYDEFRFFVTPQTEDKPSGLATVCSAIADDFSKRLVIQIKTSLLGSVSGASRAEKAVQGELVEAAAAEQSPLLGAGLSLMGKRAKGGFLNNPMVLQFLMSKLQGGAVATGAASGNHAQNNDGNGFAARRGNF